MARYLRTSSPILNSTMSFFMMKRVLNLRQTILSRLYFSLISFACERTIQCFLLRFFYTRNLLSSETIFRVNVSKKNIESFRVNRREISLKKERAFLRHGADTYFSSFPPVFLLFGNEKRAL